MVTLKQIAQAVGVSTATVSRVLTAKGEVSDATRLRVQDADASLGYTADSVARALVSLELKGLIREEFGAWRRV